MHKRYCALCAMVCHGKICQKDVVLVLKRVYTVSHRRGRRGLLILRGENKKKKKEDMNQIKNLIKEQDTRIDQIFKEQDAHFDQKFREQDARIDQKFREQDARIDQRFKEQDARFDQRFKEQDARIDQKFKEQDARFDQKFERMETRLMDMIDHRFHQQQLYLENNFGAAFQSLKEYLPPTGKTYSGLEERVDSLETRTNDGYTILKQHEQRLDSIERIVGQGIPTLVSDRSAE